MLYQETQDFNELLMKAEAGDTDAQASVGEIYFRGTNGLKKNLAEARKWFEKAAIQNNPIGYWGLGELYYYGEGGFQKDYAKAKEYAEKSSNLNCPNGMNLIGNMYSTGHGLEESDIEACRWYRKAADLGFSIAQFNLGGMYLYGQGVGQNDTEAYRWYRMAAEQGIADAQNNLGWMFQNGRGVQKDDSEAPRWFRMAAEQGSADAQCNLGRMYKNGMGVEKNVTLAVELFSKAVESNPDHLGDRADLYHDIGRYDDAIKDWYEYYKGHEPIKQEGSQGFKYDDVLERNYSGLKQKIASFHIKEESFVYYTSCDIVWDMREEQSMYNGTSYTHLYGTYGTGYIALTDKNIYLCAFHDMSKKYPTFKKSIIGIFLGRTSDYRKAISSDFASQIIYDSITSYHQDKNGNLIIQLGQSEIKIFPYFSEEIDMVCSVIKLVKRGELSAKGNASSGEQDYVNNLKKLKELYDSGILTQVEYDEKKNSILAKMGL